MRLPENVADLLIDRQAYRVCRLLPTQRFVHFCAERGMLICADRLHKLERLGLFTPILRIWRPDDVRKVEYIDGGRRYRDLGSVRPGEAWEGDTRTELGSFGFNAEVVRSWRAHGFAWDPRTAHPPNLPSWESEPHRHEAYYSRFQIDHLSHLLQMLTLRVQMEWALEDDGITPAAGGADRQAWMADHVRHAVENRRQAGHLDLVGPLCQLISDRYYPNTQTDERRFTLSTGDIGEWDWYDFAQQWDARFAIDCFHLTREQIKSLYERLSIEQQHIDPIAAWHPLVRFVSMDKRRRLKGDALMAMSLREMALMLRMLHRDAFGEVMVEPNEVGTTIFHRIPDVEPEHDPLRALELVANDFGVNPQPQLVLFVEGATEETVIPIILARLFGAGPSIFGIQLVNMGGVAAAAGGKENPFSAVWRLIDYLHHHGTIAVVLMDNEGFAARNLQAGLPRAASIYLNDRLTTRAEYVKLWRFSFELDNFSDAEIAQALSALGEMDFSREEVARCRESARHPSRQGRARTISTLYTERTGEKLDKVALGRVLVDAMFVAGVRRSLQNRPIVRFLTKVAGLATRNRQPNTHAIWEYIQRTGRFGTLRPGAAARRKDPLGRPRPRRRLR